MISSNRHSSRASETALRRPETRNSQTIQHSSYASAFWMPMQTHASNASIASKSATSSQRQRGLHIRTTKHLEPSATGQQQAIVLYSVSPQSSQGRQCLQLLQQHAKQHSLSLTDVHMLPREQTEQKQWPAHLPSAEQSATTRRTREPVPQVLSDGQILVVPIPLRALLLSLPSLQQQQRALVTLCASR